VSVYFPLVGFFCTFFVPLPIIYYRAKLGRNTAVVIPAAGLVVMMYISGGLSADVLMFFELLLLGFVIGDVLEKDLSVDRTVVYSCGTVLAAGAACLLLFSAAADMSVFDMVSAYVKKNLDLTLVLYEKMGMPAEHIQMIAGSLDAIHYVLVRIIPGLLVVFFMVITWLNLLMARSIFAKRGLPFPEFGTLTLWKAPEMLVWGVILSGTLLLMPAGPLKMTGINGLLIFLTVFFFEGIAIVTFFFDKKKLPVILRIFFYSLIALQQFILLLVIGIGFFDMWINFRKLKTDDPES